MARGTKSSKVPVLLGLLVLMGLLAWYLLSARQAGEIAGPGAEQTPPAASASSEPAKPAEPAPAPTAPQTGAPSAAPATPVTAAAPGEGQSTPPAAPSSAAPSPTPAAAVPTAAAPPTTTPAAPAPAAAMPAPATPSAAAVPAPAAAAKPGAAKPAAAAAEPQASTAATAGGETSPELGQIQRLLVKLGYEPGAVDGRMRASTTRAIRLFQGDVGLKVDGRPTKELLAYMRKLAGNE